MSDDLERLAERGAERRRRDEARRIARSHEPDPEERKRRGMSAISVVGWGTTLTLPLIGILPIGMVLLAGAVGLEGAWVIPAILLGIGAFAGVFFGVSSLDHRYQRRWLAALPWGIDVPRYLAEFSHQMGFGARLVVTLRFARRPDAAEGRRLADVAMGALRGASASFDEKLVITGPRRKTAFMAKGGMAYSNHRLHRWFRACVRRALHPIHGRCAVAEVTVAMETAS